MIELDRVSNDDADASQRIRGIRERFLDDLERGMPDSGGNALGVDRLLMLLVGAGSIQSVMVFPEERL